MKKNMIVYFGIICLTFILFFSACKTSEETLVGFSITYTGGSALNITADPNGPGNVCTYLLCGLRNNGSNTGTITAWNFKIRYNYISLVEINQSNYQNFNLTMTDNATIGADEVKELSLRTQEPAEQHGVPKSVLNFDLSLPNEVVAEITITQDNGDVFVITGKGSFTYDVKQTVTDYDIRGSWEFKATIDGTLQAKQKIVFIGSKNNGNYVLYNFATLEALENGNYSVSGQNISFTSTTGSKYYGEFSNTQSLTGTLFIPETNDTSAKTGSWQGKKL